MSVFYVRCRADDPEAGEAVHQTARAMVAAKRHEPRLIVDLDGAQLEPAVVAALVRALRVVRAAGGGVVLEPRIDAVRETLRRYGLDRVFA